MAASYARIPDLGHRDHYQQRLDTLATSLREDDFEVATELCVGPVTHEVLRVARERAADELLAGSHGHGTLRDLLLGSTVEALCRHAERLVMIVPD